MSEEQIPHENPISADDIAAADRLASRETTADERDLMTSALGRMRDNLKVLRTSPFATGDPATRFDPVLPGTPLPSGESVVSLSDRPLPEYDGHPESLAFLRVAEIARLVQARHVTSVELTRMYLGRLKTYGPRLLCVVSLCEEQALQEAAQADAEIAMGRYRGPLHGIPYGLKDLLAARGTRTTYGAPPYAEQLLDYDATVTERLREAGAVLVAKLSLGELAMGDVWFGGMTRNPWKPETGSSGSSAGSASAVAAGLVGFAIGTETLGSIVSPCNVCGTTGLRPTFGRVPRFGAMPLSWTMDKIGPICRGVEDCALILAAIQGPDGKDLSATTAVPFRWQPDSGIGDLTVGLDQASLEAMQSDEKGKTLWPVYERALEDLAGLGVRLQPLALPPRNPAYDALAWTVICVEGAAAFADLAARGGLRELAQQGGNNWPNWLRVGATVPAADYIQALRIRAQLQRDMADTLEGIDVYVSFLSYIPSHAYTNLTGYPTVITRCGMTGNGLPVSLEFVGNLYREDAALHLAFAFEQATPWHREWPFTENLPETPPAPLPEP
jgi:Asp-tRNA(Asn)/Glu-tRNA(Gln) amidotransferase A subunit family amidase